MDCGAIMTGGIGPTFFCFLSCLVTPKTSSSKVKALGNYCNEAWDQNENLTMWAFPSVILSPSSLSSLSICSGSRARLLNRSPISICTDSGSTLGRIISKWAEVKSTGVQEILINNVYGVFFIVTFRNH